MPQPALRQPSFDPLPPVEILRELLAATDDFAVQTVKANQGGPFGASLHVYDSASGVLTPVLGLRANAVLKTGMASAHAEDQALTPDMIAALDQALQGRDPATTSVIMSSSGESCPACHTKEEITARHFMARGQLLPGRFFVTYGATYQEAFDVAGFDDAKYAVDIAKPRGAGMIGIATQTLDSLAPRLRAIFSGAAGPLAVIALANEVYIPGEDRRASGDLMATPEMSAIRDASRHQMENDSRSPFNLGTAQLYTATPAAETSPLAYATAQWANVTDIIAVDGLPPAVRQAIEDAPGTPNRDLFRIVAQPYNGPDSAITVLHITPFVNRAQQAWRVKSDAIQYNGV